MPRTAIISDIHSNLHALYAVMEDIGVEQCTDVVCLGDIVGYNAYPHECLDYIRSLNCPVVKGNHDAEVAEESALRVNEIARRVINWTRAQLTPEELQWLSRLQFQRIVRSSFTIVHSSLDQPKAWNYIINAHDASSSFPRQFSPVCFHGHTHVPKVFEWDGRHASELKDIPEALGSAGVGHGPLTPQNKYFINVGSVGQPRDGDPRACYAIYDSDTRMLTLRRVEYDIASAQQAVLAAGLPAYLAERLAGGA